MKLNDFDLNTALSLLDSTDDFPVDFDVAWQWLGYQRKDYAKDVLVKNFKRELDYIVEFSGLNRKTPQGGRPSEIIKLTLDCLKMLGMMAGTQKGREVRYYFLECERKLKQILSDPLSIKIIEHRATAKLEQWSATILEGESARKNGSSQKLETMPEIAPHLAAIVKRSRRVGAVDAINIRRSILIFRHTQVGEIRSYFRQLADLSYGTCDGAGTKLRFTAYVQSSK